MQRSIKTAGDLLHVIQTNGNGWYLLRLIGCRVLSNLGCFWRRIESNRIPRLFPHHRRAFWCVGKFHSAYQSGRNVCFITNTKLINSTIACDATASSLLAVTLLEGQWSGLLLPWKSASVSKMNVHLLLLLFLSMHLAVTLPTAKERELIDSFASKYS